MGKPDQPRGPDGRWIPRGGSAAVAAVALGGAVAFGLSGTSSMVPGGALDSTLSQAVRAKLEKGKISARNGRRDAAWRDLGLKGASQQVRRGASCVSASYGEVQRFFAHTPCRSLRRILFKLDDEHGNSIIVSVSWVEMYRARAAHRLRALADRDGTGNVSPLPEELVGVDDVEWSGRYYDSRPAGRVTVIAEAEPVRGAPDPAFVDGVAQVAAHLPRP